jgi:hypothetical protein
VIGLVGSTTSLTGFVPVSGTIDAGNSHDPDGAIVKFEWDLDGDGTFELDSGLDAVQLIEQTEPRGFHVQLKATDNDGVSAIRQVAVRGFAAWTRSWGGGGADSFWSSAYDGVGSLYMLGTTNSYGAGFTDALLVKLNLAGEIVWQQTWGTSADDFFTNVSIDGDGNLIAAGTTDDAGATLVKFNPDGGVVWSKRYSPIVTEFIATSVDVIGTDFLLCGFKNVTGQTNPGYVARIDSDGNPLWCRKWESGAISLRAVQDFRSSISSTSVAVCGSRDADVFLLTLGEDGAFEAAEAWGGAAEEEALDVVATGPFNPEFWLCGALIEGDYRKALLLERGNSPVARIWDAGSTDLHDDIALSLAYVGGTGIFLSGWSSSFGDSADGLLLEFDTSGSLQSSSGLHDLGNDTQLTGELGVLSSTALVCTGMTDRAQGNVWNPASGSVTPVSMEWYDLINSVTSVSIPVADLTGTVVDVDGAVMDSGGGGASDALIAVVEAP